MKKILIIALSLIVCVSYAQVSPGYPWQSGQILTAAALNAAIGGATTHQSGALTLNTVLLGNGGGDITALSSVGAAGQVLTSSGSGLAPVWANTSGLVNPMTTLGDTIYGASSGTPQRLPIGTSAQILTVVGGVPVWATNAYQPGSVAITGGSINGTSIGATTPGSGAFSTITASGQLTSTLATGTAPLSVSSTTPVTNLSIGGNAATATTATNQSGGTVSATTITATSGAITPHYPAGIVGNATGSVTAGSIGENNTSTVTSGLLVSNTQTNVTSITVTAGNWLVFGLMTFIPNPSTVVANEFGGFSTTSASLVNYIAYVPSGSAATGTQVTYTLPTQFYSSNSGFTIYCIADMVFSVSNATATCSMTVLRIG